MRSESVCISSDLFFRNPSHLSSYPVVTQVSVISIIFVNSMRLYNDSNLF
jgi:hypothetical protein